ncbi:MAG: hypothetical protein IPM79_00650 [Polyangiaceae bacterium]|nr:hypothetical protein [Polyangiaceae bacterium]
MDQTKKQGRGSRGTLRAMMGALTVLGIAVMATGAGMGCSDPCANTVEDKNDECSFAATFNNSCNIGSETCLKVCNDLYECDAGEEAFQDCYDSCGLEE